MSPPFLGERGVFGLECQLREMAMMPMEALRHRCKNAARRARLANLPGIDRWR